MKLVNLKDGEKILHIQRISVLPFLTGILFGLFMLLLPFFFFFSLIAFGMYGVFLLTIISLIGVVFLVRGIIRYKGTMCVLTNWRIIQIKQKGFFDRSVAYSSFSKVTDIAYKKRGLSGALFGIGSVRVSFSGVTPSMLFKYMRDPFVLSGIIKGIAKI